MVIFASFLLFLDMLDASILIKVVFVAEGFQKSVSILIAGIGSHLISLAAILELKVALSLLFIVSALLLFSLKLVTVSQSLLLVHAAEANLAATFVRDILLSTGGLDGVSYSLDLIIDLLKGFLD